MMRLRAPLVWITLLAAAGGTTLAADKRETGTIDGNLYRDGLYGFSFAKYENWKFGKIEKEEAAKPEHIRFGITQKNFVIPAERQANPETFTTPSLGVWVDTSSLTVDSFVAQIVDRKSKMRWRKELAASFPLIDKGDLGGQGRVQVGGSDGVSLQFRMDYDVQVYDRTYDKYSMIQDVLLGDLYAVRNQGRMYVFYFRCERSAYRLVKEEVKSMISTVNFKPKADTTAQPGN